MLCLGGGGYTPRNVSRLWCYETSIMTNVELNSKLPDSLPFRSWFEPDFSLHPNLGDRFENKNSKKYLDNLRVQLMENLRYLNQAPSVQMQEIPPDLQNITDDADAKILERLKRESRVDKFKDEERYYINRKDESRRGELLD
jgi:histone deacetylase HOS2